MKVKALGAAFVMLMLVTGVIGLGQGAARNGPRQAISPELTTEEQAYTNLLNTGARMKREGDKGPVIELNVQSEDHSEYFQPLHNDDLRDIGAFKHLRLLEMTNAVGVTDLGMAHLKPLKELQIFILDHSQVTDAGLRVLAGLPKLKYIELTWDQKIDTLTPLEHLVQLEGIKLNWDQKINDRSIAPLENMIGLTSIDFSHTNVTGAALKYLKKLNKLERLSLGDTKIRDGLENIDGLRNIKNLILAKTNVNSNTIKPIAKMAHLVELDLSLTHITDAGLVHVEGLSDLQVLGLDYTDITDAGLVHLKGLHHLVELQLDDTYVTPAGIAAIQRVLPNCRIIHARLKQGHPRTIE